jgi:hypothetical protein
VARVAPLTIAWYRTHERARRSGADLALCAALVALVVAAWIYFS